MISILITISLMPAIFILSFGGSVLWLDRYFDLGLFDCPCGCSPNALRLWNLDGEV